MIDMGGTHDDEPTRWTSIGWQALLITNRLRNQAQLTEPNEKQNDNAGDKRDSSDPAKDHVPDKSADIERRVRDILAMENRLRRKRI